MVAKLNSQDLDGGISLIDLGSSGNLDSYWSGIERFINLYAFDPNQEECKRLSSLPHKFASANYLPYAIAGETGSYTLYKTNSIYCWSLLEPNKEWLSRFAYHDLFTVHGSELIKALSLSDVNELKDVEIDAVKADVQGLELLIYRNAQNIIDSAFFVESETGFTHNYE